jgi:ABC-2 type transport system permease protein
MSALANDRTLPTRTSAIAQVAWAMLKTARHSWRDLVLAVFTPLLILVLFAILGNRDRTSSSNLAAASFPAIVGLTAMLGSNFIAVRIVTWRQLGVYQRLACAPTPLGDIVMGQSLAQTVLSSVQALIVVIFGVAVLRLPLNVSGALLAVGVLMLGAGCFIAYGMLLASLTRKPDTASALVMFTLLPMFFLSGVFPESFLPAMLQRISSLLPATMLNTSLTSLMVDGALSAQSLTALFGLVVYTGIFALIAAHRFRWE